MKRKIGIVGTGVMGRGMAKNFIRNDCEVYVWNRTAAVCDTIEGAKKCDSPKEVALQSDIVFEVTANDNSSKSVWLGDMGILAGANADSILITSATLSADWIMELVEHCRKESRVFLDMPLTGGRNGAENGRLTLLCGGNTAVLDTIREDLAAISRKIIHFGEAGNGMKYKLITNMLQTAHLQAFGEAMKLAKSGGLDERVVAEALCEKPGGMVTNFSAAFYFDPPEQPVFTLNWLLKDLEYASKMGQEKDLRILDTLIDRCKEGIKAGKGDEDWSIVNKI